MERHVVLSRPHKDGKTLFDHLEQAAKALGFWPQDYEPIPPPDGSQFVWEIFWELRNAAAQGFSGPMRLCFNDLAAWQQVRGVRLGNFVVDMLLAMDAAYMAEWNKKK